MRGRGPKAPRKSTTTTIQDTSTPQWSSMSPRLFIYSTTSASNRLSILAAFRSLRIYIYPEKTFRTRTVNTFTGPRRYLYLPAMAPPPLQKLYMSKDAKPKKVSGEPRPSARYLSSQVLQHSVTNSRSILLISTTNQILLLHRVRTSSSFPSAHVFPGGNLEATHDGEIPSPTDPKRHVDGPVYRTGAIRECFEESGILLAKAKNGQLLEIPEDIREQGRKDIHAGKVKFLDWVEAQGGVVDTGMLVYFCAAHSGEPLILHYSMLHPP